LQRLKKGAPLSAKRRDLFSAGSREPVAAAAAAVGQSLPFRVDPALSFQPVEHGIQRSHIEAQHASGLLLDLLGDFVPVQRVAGEQSQHGKFCAAPLDLCVDGCHLV
jgi:hypothetical protein